MSAYVQHASVLSGRSMVMLVTIGLHLLLIAGLMSVGVIPIGHDPKPKPMQVWVDEPPKPTDTWHPKTPTTVPVNRPSLPPQFPDLFRTDEEHVVQDSKPIAIEPGEIGTDEGPVPPPPTDIVYRTMRSPDDFYPATSIRLQEQGVATVQFCVSANGALDGMPKVVSGSGSPRLDAAAIAWARGGLQFRPATRGGAPVAACRDVRVRFALR
jgi:TonB family protein